LCENVTTIFWYIRIYFVYLIMKHYVYKIVNSNNEIEYIGETKNPKTRLRNHTCKNGNFAGRKDLTLEIIKEFKSKKLAFNYQCKLQKKFGFETDIEKYIKLGKSIQKIGTECRKVKIVGYDLSGNEIGIFSSILEASKKLKIHNSLIWNVVNGVQKSTKNLIFIKK